jgi:hypothetical protein
MMEERIQLIHIAKTFVNVIMCPQYKNNNLNRFKKKIARGE